MPRRSPRRVALAAAGVSLLFAVALPATAADGARRSKGCKASQVRHTVKYKVRKGGRTRRARGCAPRKARRLAGSVLAALPIALREGRGIATRLSPKRIKRLRRGRAARRVAKADRATDRSLARSLGGARAAAVHTDSDTTSVKGPPGTTSEQRRTFTVRDDAEPNPGGVREVEVDTRSTRIAGLAASNTKTITEEDEMPRCPDAGGAAAGRVRFVVSETFTMDRPGGGQGVVQNTDTFDGRLTVQFDDSATIATADVTGDWSYVTQTRSGGNRGPRNFVSGTVTGTTLGPASAGSNHRDVDFTTNVTGASGDKPALQGDIGRPIMAHQIAKFFIEEVVSDIQRRALSGDCVRVEADPATVHVKPRGTVEIGGRLIGADGAPFSGPITAQAERGGSVTPEVAQASPRATFTYHAAAAKPPGGTDSVGLRHTSKRGRARAGGVTVIYDTESSHSYRVLAASLDETFMGTKPGASFISTCPEFRNRQDNTLTLGVQPVPTGPPGSNGHLLQGPDGFIGQITTFGPAAVSTQVRGCNIATDPPSVCTGTGSDTIAKDIGFDITLPTTGPAQLRWRFDDHPIVGLGGSEAPFPPCLAPPISGDTEGDFSAGERSVPREVFEAATPQTLTVAIDLVLVAPDLVAPGQIHAVENYSITIQRVRDDGSPL
jgi:hypothetical protein